MSSSGPVRAEPPERLTQSQRAIAWIVAAAAMVWVLAGTRPEQSFGDTLFSRLATVYALVHEGTFSIDGSAVPENPFADRTVDKVQFGGRMLSSKPPVLPLLMAAEYVVMNRAAGWRLDDAGDLSRITWIMTVTLVGLPYVAMAWFVVRAAQSVPLSAGAAAFLGVAAAFGTQAGGFATVLNNHVPAASAVMATFFLYLRIEGRGGAAKWWEYGFFGASAGLAATIDVPVAIFPALLGLALVRRHMRGLALYAIPPALAFLAVQSGVLYASTGSPLPVQLHPDAYLFENSYWRNPRGVDALNDPWPIYLFHITLGRAGIFSLFPVTLLAFAGLVCVERAAGRFSAAMICGVAGSAVLAAYYALTTNNYGGAAFGFRWFIVLGPVLLLVAAPAAAAMRGPWRWALPVLLLAVSMYSAWECARHPWRPNEEWTVRAFGPSL
jgi:hypothetical protein